MKTKQKIPLVVPIVMAGFLSAMMGNAQEIEVAENRLEPSAPHIMKVQKPVPIRGRVWTNEDFPTPPAPEIDAPAPAGDESAASASTAAPAPTDPMVEEARKEVAEQMLQIAKDREKAYDGTIDLVRAQLQAEKNEFRSEVLQQILDDTLRLKEINKHMLEQFEPKPAQEQVSATLSGEGRAQ